MNAPLRLRAPRQDRAVLADPPLESAGALVAANREALAKPALSIADIPLGELRQRIAQASQQQVEQARQQGQQQPQEEHGGAGGQQGEEP